MSATITKGRKHFGASGEPFILTVAGETVYVVTSPDDVNGAWNKSQAISLQPIVEEIYSMVGISEKSKKPLVTVHEGAKYNKGMAKPLHPTDMINELHWQTLRNGPLLDEMMRNSTIPAMSKKLEFAQGVDSTYPITISLFDLCVDIFIGMDTDTYFGPKLRKLEPDLVRAFKSWEYSNWQLIYQVPEFFSKEVRAAKHTLIDAFTRYFKTPRSERPGAILFVTALEDMLRELGLAESDIGKFMLPHYMAIFANVWKVGFWVVARLAHNPLLLQNIREEVAPAVQGDEIDETYLLDQCPKLHSLFNETLRLTVQHSLNRMVVEPTVIGGKLLQPGHRIMLPINELHLEVETWGKDSESFAPNRFVDDPKLAKSSSYRPWGGGSTVCPGRFFARRAINAFVALLVTRYELEAESENFPTADTSRPSPGAVLIGQGQDVKMRCTPRTQ
ncbi:putative cytochrome P450 [Phaeosphaeria sp. MPI-PUGE-AT-0046c]|nr:putative cytochrome P450 [Phaeosphaeria sp. MPI-PUGE-AT-0046c]